jgi:aldehyde dehydrogenase (NAD+)|tara:strand:- start:43239 stop:44762 length:1524 start_codon:yes stop_codon:yes gene_type:complete
MEIAMTQYKNYIGGQWIDSTSNKLIDVTNPAHCTKVLATVQDSNEEDINKAVEEATKAFRSWKKVPAPKRGEILFKAAEILVRDKEDIAKMMTKEMGKPLSETRGDVQEAIDMGYYAAGEGRRLGGKTVPSELNDKFCMSMRMPIGVIGAITPWNFPIAIPSWKAFPALVAGNTMVIKPAEDTPLSVLRLAMVFEEAGLPAGVFNVVTGYGPTAGQPLVEHPDVKMISFTGSTITGHQVATRCAEQMKPYSLEMGGKNAIVVMEDADIDLAVDGVVWGAFGTTGQRCTACSRVFVHESVKAEFTEKLVKRAGSLMIGDGLDAKVQMGPVINEKALNKIHMMVTEASSTNTILCGGKINKKPTDNIPFAFGQYTTVYGWFYMPTVITDVDVNDMIAQDEVFGPVVAIISFGETDEVIDMVNNSKYGLSAAVYTANVNFAFRALNEIDTGITYINSSTIGAEIQLPFGGTKGTGNGHREAGHNMIDNCTEWKSVFVDYSGTLQKAQIED